MGSFDIFAEECNKHMMEEIESILAEMQGKEFCSIGLITTDDLYGFYLTWNDRNNIGEFYDWENGSNPTFLYQPVVDVVDAHKEIDFCSPNEEKWNFAVKILKVLGDSIKNLPEDLYKKYGYERKDVLYFATMGDGDYMVEMMRNSLELFNTEETIEKYGIDVNSLFC
ncbi:MAG: hypothetical protein Q4D51_09230 [Eubacteriales bacterium]|nr:hypothetical protein [Eubacteriales bacterium]